jgi:hypothetical protein
MAIGVTRNYDGDSGAPRGGGHVTAEDQVVSIVVRMPAELHAALKARAAYEGRSMAELMRDALRRYIASAEAAA